MMCHRIGLPPISTIGLGLSVVSSLSREPRPPARITAFTRSEGNLPRPMARSALITGITGQDGSYLAELLLEHGYEVHGMVRRASTEKFDRIEHLRDRITLHQGDLLDQRSLVDTLRAAAARRDLQPRRDELRRGVVAPADADGGVHRRRRYPDARGDARGGCPDARFYQASSSEMFGKVLEVPQTETTPFYPRSPYGVAKAYGHFITVNYRESYDLFACSGILFNHESPRRGLEFVTRKITWHAAAIKHGLRDELALGNLDAERDWGYAKDYVEAMYLMLQQDEPEDFVIATQQTQQRPRLRQDRVRRGRRSATGSATSGSIRPFLRPAEVDQLIGNPAKAKSELGWEPRTSFEELIRLMTRADLELLSS